MIVTNNRVSEAPNHFIEDGVLLANTGDSYVLLVSWGPDGTVSSYSIHQYGSATLDEASVHFNDQSST